MGISRVHTLVWCCCLLGVLAFAARAEKDRSKDLPKGSEKAVAAVTKAFPKAEIDEAAEPKGFGGSGGKGTPLFWTVRFHSGAKKQELSVTPEGVIIRLPIPVQVNDLPKAVAAAVARAAPGETVKSAEKHEMRATLKDSDGDLCGELVLVIVPELGPLRRLGQMGLLALPDVQERVVQVVVAVV